MSGTARPNAVTIIPAGSSARWDIPGFINVVQLYLPQHTLARVATEAGKATSGDLLERTEHLDLTTSRLLMTATEVMVGNDSLDALFRQQLTDIVATRLLTAHSGAPGLEQPVSGGLSPTALRRAIERLNSDCDEDVSLAALAVDAGLSRFHFCRAFKKSMGLSPHAWLRQHRLEQAKRMLRDPPCLLSRSQRRLVMGLKPRLRLRSGGRPGSRPANGVTDCDKEQSFSNRDSDCCSAARKVVSVAQANSETIFSDYFWAAIPQFQIGSGQSQKH